MVTRGKDGEGIVREFGMDMDTLLYLPWRTSKDLLDSTGNSARCRGVWGRRGTCVCMAESLCCPPETITTLLISYTPIAKKKNPLIFRGKIRVALDEVKFDMR